MACHGSFWLARRSMAFMCKVHRAVPETREVGRTVMALWLREALAACRGGAVFVGYPLLCDSLTQRRKFSRVFLVSLQHQAPAKNVSFFWRGAWSQTQSPKQPVNATDIFPEKLPQLRLCARGWAGRGRAAMTSTGFIGFDLSQV